MVERDIAARGITDERVLQAMARVPREAFVPRALRGLAYRDGPLPIAAGQTISQPYIVARMMQALELKGGERVLDIGTGSGYAAAILGLLAERVYTVERHRELFASATRRLRELGTDNVEARHGNGILGWPEASPFDAIHAAAAVTTVPRAFVDQLEEGGRLVLPLVTAPQTQHLVAAVLRRGTLETRHLERVRFVPMVDLLPE